MRKLLRFVSRVIFTVVMIGLTGCSSEQTELQEGVTGCSLEQTELKEEVIAPLKQIKVDYYQYEGEPQAIKFYENDTNIFYFSEPIEEYLTVIYEDGTTQRVREALQDGRIIPEDLGYYGVEYFTESKVVEKISYDDTMPELPCVVVPFYYDTRFRYSFGAPAAPYITVYFKDGTEMNVVEALEQGKIFIMDLDEFGITYFRKFRKFK